MNQTMRAAMSALDADGDMTANDMAEHLGLAASHVRKHATQKLHALGLIRVSGWIPGRFGNPMRVWSLTDGKDAPRPKPQRKAVICRRYRANALNVQANNALAILCRGFAKTACDFKEMK
jgi:predicted ArsR family transcriptional regulator